MKETLPSPAYDPLAYFTKNPVPVLAIPGSFMEFPGSLHPLPKLLCALIYAPKLVCALVWALLCALVCAPKLMCALICPFFF